MIAKNEEQFIEQAITSVLPLVSEIILVDTGSSDRTCEIARALGAQIHHQEWSEDFSLPRNLSIQLAKSEWILVLDADEAIDSADLAKIRELTLDRTKCYKLTQRHYTNDPRLSNFVPVSKQYPQWEKNYGGYFESSLVRLFPNGDGLKYIGRVHELIEYSVPQVGKHKILESNIILHHYGHTPEVRSRKNKGSLYTPLGQAKLSDDPKNWQAYFELGIEHNNNGKRKESVEAFLKSIEMNPNYLLTWVNLGYVFCELAMYSEAANALQNALKLDSKSCEAWCNLGVVYLRTEKYQQAERCFSNAVAINPAYVNAMTNLAKALTYQRRLSEAAHFLKRAIEMLPQSPTAKLDLGIVYCTAGRFDLAEHWLKEAEKLSSELPLLHYHLALIYKATKRVDQALTQLNITSTLIQKGAPSSDTEGFLNVINKEIAEIQRTA